MGQRMYVEIELDSVITVKRLEIPAEHSDSSIKKRQYVREYYEMLGYKVGHIKEC